MAIIKLNVHQLEKFPIHRKPQAIVMTDERGALLEDEKNVLAIVFRDPQGTNHHFVIMTRDPALDPKAFTAHTADPGSFDSEDDAFTAARSALEVF